MIQVKYPSLTYDWAYVLCAPNQRPLATLCSRLSPVRRGGHNIPVTYLETRAHSQGQEQSCAVASFKSEMDGLKIIEGWRHHFLHRILLWKFYVLFARNKFSPTCPANIGKDSCANSI